MTNLKPMTFEDGVQVNVVLTGETYTYVCTSFEMREAGVMLEYTDGTAFRVFVPWHRIDRVFQAAS